MVGNAPVRREELWRLPTGTSGSWQHPEGHLRLPQNLNYVHPCFEIRSSLSSHPSRSPPSRRPPAGNSTPSSTLDELYNTTPHHTTALRSAAPPAPPSCRLTRSLFTQCTRANLSRCTSEVSHSVCNLSFPYPAPNSRAERARTDPAPPLHPPRARLPRLVTMNRTS